MIDYLTVDFGVCLWKPCWVFFFLSVCIKKCSSEFHTWTTHICHSDKQEALWATFVFRIIFVNTEFLFCKQLFFDQPIFTLISLHDTHFRPFNSLFLVLIYLHNASISPECFPLSAHHASFHTPPSPLAEGLSLGLFPLQAADLCMPALWAGEICSIVSEQRSPLDMEVVWIQAR